jgi:hypothetical protein
MDKMELTNILTKIKELKAEIIKENGNNNIILKISNKDLLLWLVSKDVAQDEEINKIKEKVNILCAIIIGTVITLIASLFMERII